MQSRLWQSALRVRSRGRGHGVIGAVTLMITLAGSPASAHAAELAKPAAPADADASQVSVIVAGIVSYTRWPEQDQPVRLCTLGRGPGVDELLGAGDLGSPQRSVPVRAASIGNVGDGCDVVYVGALAVSATRAVLQAMVGQPVLMIGEGREFCSDGGMFCLQPGATASFAVNLDAIARSGLRINPWVLRIARNAPARGQ
jgi:hypothetical protein